VDKISALPTKGFIEPTGQVKDRVAKLQRNTEGAKARVMLGLAFGGGGREVGAEL
jgi:hypothetical protein